MQTITQQIYKNLCTIVPDLLAIETVGSLKIFQNHKAFIEFNVLDITSEYIDIALCALHVFNLNDPRLHSPNPLAIIRITPAQETAEVFEIAFISDTRSTPNHSDELEQEKPPELLDYESIQIFLNTWLERCLDKI